MITYECSLVCLGDIQYGTILHKAKQCIKCLISFKQIQKNYEPNQKLN